VSLQWAFYLIMLIDMPHQNVILTKRNSNQLQIAHLDIWS